jgi:glutathionylspermidine synthase
VKETEEDFRTVEYIRQTAEEAGFEAKFIFMEDIGWNGTEFVDLEERPIKALFKLYPWEWMVIEGKRKSMKESERITTCPLCVCVCVCMCELDCSNSS